MCNVLSTLHWSSYDACQLVDMPCLFHLCSYHSVKFQVKVLLMLKATTFRGVCTQSVGPPAVCMRHRAAYMYRLFEAAAAIRLFSGCHARCSSFAV